MNRLSSDIIRLAFVIFMALYSALHIFKIYREHQLTFNISPFPALRVAHGGGIIDGRKVTDSYQAMENSVTSGYQFIELDFNFTQDGHLVCLHDWQHSLALLRNSMELN